MLHLPINQLKWNLNSTCFKSICNFVMFVSIAKTMSTRKTEIDCLYGCTVHFEDSLNITHQQMHQSYIIY